MISDRITATYLIETAGSVAKVADQLAGEQSTATSTRVPLETDELIAAHRANVESIEPLGPVEHPSFPMPSDDTGPYHRARITITWPVHNVGHSLPMLSTMLMGNQTGMSSVSGLRLEHVGFPAGFVSAMPRPAFGIAGTRRLANVHGRPLIGSVIKPNIGLSPEQTAQVVDTLCAAGVDFIKDDELISNPPYSPLKARVDHIMPVIERHADRTGKKVMYAFNVTGDADEIREGHDYVLQRGGTCVMVNLNGVGLGAIAALRKHSALPLHGHRAGWAALTRSPLQGLDFQPYQAMFRLAGIDHIHVSGLGRKFWEGVDSVAASAKACRTPLASGKTDDTAVPVVSGGSTIRHAAATYDMVGSVDLIYVCGSGIMSHPGGPRDGVISMRQAWSCAIDGGDLDGYAKHHPELLRAMEFWPQERS